MSTIDKRQGPESSVRPIVPACGPILALAASALFTGPARADDAEVARLLKGKGAEVTESGGAVTGLTVRDGSKWTDDDFRQLARLGHLKTLDLSNCLTDERLSQLAALEGLEYLQTNLAAVSDEGVKPLARLRNLKTLKFFHPGKSFTGAGLTHLAGLPNLRSLTVAGSRAFGDNGMAAVATLTGLTEFRSWHAGWTDEGVKKLQALKSLKNLYLWQRLTYETPACPTDETVGVLAEMKSLESLQLDEARLTYAALRRLKELPALKRLTLGGIDIPEEEAGRLKQELPQVKVERTEPTEAQRKRIRALFGGG